MELGGNWEDRRKYRWGKTLCMVKARGVESIMWSVGVRSWGWGLMLDRPLVLEGGIAMQ